ncbi:hypothetical protein [Dankookia sp. P2]|uniref:hypothetical protein n=1 Tax=Dankookia sp. P2 TaxID=3423955 RepID=UPI003D67701B
MQAESPVLLVVEDDFLVRLTLVDALSDGGFEVLEAADAKEALTWSATATTSRRC